MRCVSYIALIAAVALSGCAPATQSSSTGDAPPGNGWYDERQVVPAYGLPPPGYTPGFVSPPEYSNLPPAAPTQTPRFFNGSVEPQRNPPPDGDESRPSNPPPDNGGGTDTPPATPAPKAPSPPPDEHAERPVPQPPVGHPPAEPCNSWWDPCHFWQKGT
jgi:hypothetical protein